MAAPLDDGVRCVNRRSYADDTHCSVTVSTMEFESNRRRFLELAGPTTAAALAGCSSLTGSGPEQTETASSTDAQTETRTVGASVQPDQQALRERQAEIRSELQSGNVSRAEAQQQFRRAQNELRAQAMASFRDRIDGMPALSIEDTVDQFGLFLLSGPASALIDTLSIDGIAGLLPQATFEQAKSQAQSATATTTAN